MKTVLLLCLGIVGAVAVAALSPQGKPAQAPKFVEGPHVNGRVTAYAKQPLTLVHFWTFACSNCRYNLPIYSEWEAKYKARGLKVVGVHTPELSYERDLDNVLKAVDELKITYPVLVDGEAANWKKWGVHYWPSYYLVDAHGVIRESGYGEIHEDKAGWEAKISGLLTEAGR